MKKAEWHKFQPGEFSMMKEYLSVERKWQDNAWLDMVCGLSSGVVSCIFMNPIDVVRTRYYNQPYRNGVGELYQSGFDAIMKINKLEGPKAFYKGFTTHFLRIGPHFCCNYSVNLVTFVFLGILRRNTAEVYSYLDRKESFQQFDENHDGKLDEQEVKGVIKKVLKEKANEENVFLKLM